MKIKKLLLILVGIFTIIIVGIFFIKGIVGVYSKASEYSEQTGGSIGKYTAIIVTTPSMHPAIKVGSLSLVEKYEQSDIKVGDVIMFSNKYGENIVHRVIEIHEIDSKLFFVTKGDANLEPDGVLIDDSRYLGKVVLTANWLAPLIKQFMGGTVVDYAVFKLLLVTILGAYVLYKVIRQIVLFFIASYYIFIDHDSFKKYIDKFEVVINDCHKLQDQLRKVEKINTESTLKKLRRSSHLAKMLDSIDDIKDNKNDMEKRIKKYNKGSSKGQ